MTVNHITIIATGLVALAVFGGLCIRHNVPAIEADLTLRAKEQLRAERMGWANVEADGRNIRLSGVAPDAAARERAAGIASVYGVRNIDNALETIDEFVTEGLPTTPPGLAAGQARAQQKPAASPAQDTTADPRYKLRLAVSDGGVVLDGDAPDEASRRRLVRAAQDLFGIAAVEARIEVRRGAPENWEQAATRSLEVADRLVLGEVLLVDNTVSVTGLTGTDDSERFVREALAQDFPADFATTVETGSRRELESVLRTSPGLAGRLAAQTREREDGAVRTVSSLSSGDCEARFRETQAARRILFATASDELTSDSEALLGELAEVLKLCPRSRVSIEGHTDDQGLMENNLALSQRRAESVMQFFVARGVSLSRLSARGYGEERPLIENRTAADRAVNRRIEFVFES